MLPQGALVGFRMGLRYAPCERLTSHSGFPIRRFCLCGRVFSWRRFFVDLRFTTNGAGFIVNGHGGAGIKPLLQICW